VSGAGQARRSAPRRLLALAGVVVWSLVQLLAPRPAAAAGEPEIRVTLEPEVVPAGETVAFRIEVAGDGITQPRLTPGFELDNLQLVGGPDRRQNLSVGGGGGHWLFSWTWYLRPLKAGEAAVTSLRVLVGTQEYDLPPRRIRVTPARTPGGAPGSSNNGRSDTRSGRQPGAGLGGGEELPEGITGSPELFLHAEAEPLQPFVGQRTVYSAYLYQRVGLRAMRALGLPTFEGCWSRTVDLPARQPVRVLLGGAWYERTLLLQRELYPLRSGPLELGSLTMELLVDRIRRSRFGFAPFRVQESVRQATNPVKLTVRPLPEPEQPLTEPFAGTVGLLTVETDLESTEVPVGHAATLTVTVAGDGHLEGLPAPRLGTPSAVEVLGPQEVEPTGAGTAAEASERPIRVWRYLLVPQQVGSWQLPPVEIAYFDPATEHYGIASSAIPALAAHPESASTHPKSASTAGAELRPIRSAALPGPAPRQWSRLLPWAFGVPWLLALGLLVAREAGVRWPSRPSPGNIRQLLRRFREELDGALAEDRPRRAAGGIERAWRHLLVETLGLPESEAVSAWVAALEARGVPPEPRQRLAALLEDLHFLRYAPELSDTVSLAGELADRSERLARELVR